MKNNKFHHNYQVVLVRQVQLKHLNLCNKDKVIQKALLLNNFLIKILNHFQDKHFNFYKRKFLPYN